MKDLLSHSKQARSYRSQKLNYTELTPEVIQKIDDDAARAEHERHHRLYSELKADGRTNCHRYAYELIGWRHDELGSRLDGLIRLIKSRRLLMHYDPGQLVQTEVSTEGIYGIGSEGRIRHSFIATNLGAVSVLGAGIHAPLTVAQPEELAEFFDGDIYEILEPSKYPSSTYTP